MPFWQKKKQLNKTPLIFTAFSHKTTALLSVDEIIVLVYLFFIVLNSLLKN